MSYQPPYTITNQILSLVAQISECLGRLSVNPSLSMRISKPIMMRLIAVR